MTASGFCFGHSGAEKLLLNVHRLSSSSAQIELLDHLAKLVYILLILFKRVLCCFILLTKSATHPHDEKRNTKSERMSFRQKLNKGRQQGRA